MCTIVDLVLLFTSMGVAAAQRATEEGFLAAGGAGAESPQLANDLVLTLKGYFVLLPCALILYILSSAFRQTLQNGGIPERHALEDEHDQKAFTDPDLMKTLASESMSLQARCDFRFFPMLMNRPWLKEPRSECWWGGSAYPLERSNVEWMGHQSFPNGETRRDSAKHMTLAFWRFMLRWKPVPSRWCLFAMALRGLLVPLLRALLAWTVDLVQSGPKKGSHHLDGTPERVLLYYVLMILACYKLDRALEWSYELEVAEGGPRRELKVRLQKKFMDLTPGSEDATDWPEGRCTAMIELDVPIVIQTWTTLFSICKDSFSIGLTIVLAAIGDIDFMITLSYLPIFFLLALYAILDFRLRQEQILDMAKRKRLWMSAESAMSTTGIRMSRERLRGDSEEFRRLEEFRFDFFAASFVTWYRIAHNWFVEIGSKVGVNFLNNFAIPIITWVCGSAVLEEKMTFGQFALIVLLAEIFCNAVTNIIGYCTTLLQNYPSLLAVAKVMDLPDDEGADISVIQVSSSSGAHLSAPLLPLKPHRK